MIFNHESFVLLVSIITKLGLYVPKYNPYTKKLSHFQTKFSHIEICQHFVNVKNHAYWHKLFRYELRLQETPGTISRSAATQSKLKSFVMCRTTAAFKCVVPQTFPFTTHCTVWLMCPTILVSMPANENLLASIFLIGMPRNSTSSMSIRFSGDLGRRGDMVMAKGLL